MIWAENWLSEIRNGDKKTLGLLYSVLLPKIIDWVIKNKGQEHTAQDIFQDALSDLILSDKCQKIENPEAYIFQMCKYKFYHLEDKKNKIDYPGSLMDTASMGDTSFEELETEKIKFQIMERSYNQLSELCQKVINLIRKGKKPEQIATILEMSNANTVARRKFACMASWIDLVKKDKMYHILKH